jgi:hypothetical protein
LTRGELRGEPTTACGQWFDRKIGRVAASRLEGGRQWTS